MNFEQWYDEFKKLMTNSGIELSKTQCYSFYETGMSPWDAFNLIHKHH